MKYFLFITVAMCLVAGCKKDNSSSGSNSDVDFLTQSSWKLDAIGLDINGDGKSDLPLTIEDCQADDTFTFSSNGTGIFNNNALKCETTDPATASFNWSLQNKMLTANIPGFLSGTGTINSISATAMEIWKDTTYNSVSVRAIARLKH